MGLKVLISFVMLTTCIVCPVLAADKPEFDGGYVKTVQGRYIEMKEKINFYTQIVKGKMSITSVLNLPRIYYVIDTKGMITVSKDTFKGLAIKGRYDFQKFSLHPLVRRKLHKVEGLFENHGPARKNKPFYTPGRQIETRRKALSFDTYYFQPRNKLEKGEYVAWIGKKFWLFRIQ
jgi:hypothetical protein